MTDLDLRTADERFYDTYGYRPGYPRCTGRIEGPPDDDLSELYWLVMERCREKGIETDVLARLREAEEDALEWLDEHGHPQRLYDEMIAEYDRELWEDWG